MRNEADKTGVADRSQDMALAASAVREAGQIALSFMDRNPKHWLKGDQTAVTEADIAVDRF